MIMAAEGDHWVFYFDPNRCIGCHACTVSCKQYHDRESGADDWRTVTHHEKGTFPDVSEVPISMSCMHCHDAPCEKVCPTNAIEKRESDGIVTIDREKCIGCKYCGWACPFGAPTYGDEGLMSKCNMCIGQGPGSGADADPAPKHEQDGIGAVQPNCVSDCVGDAIKAGPQSEVIQEASQAAANRFKSNNGRVIVEPFEDSTAAVDGTNDVITPFNAGD
ncbi:Fe-S-cluster-containing dehydrogenase component [Halanaeroarchaeum sp. HSR-CO]|nr:Fe-S-cluster-containing dehydrogenase component [Halanaeroarchaeum sp. HSR-CO]